VVFGIHDLWLFRPVRLAVEHHSRSGHALLVGRSSAQAGGRARSLRSESVRDALVAYLRSGSRFVGDSGRIAAAFTAGKIVGAAYLVYVGYSLIRSKSVDSNHRQSPPAIGDLDAGHFFPGLPRPIS